MKRNQRNYYRILYVQPEAPLEIITASYRTLMGPLRQHPDRGGSHETAALLNEAYAVLSDPARRRAYDRTLNKARMRQAQPGEGNAAQAVDPGAWVRDRCCPFCRYPLPGDPGNGMLCARCEAPLSAPPRPPGSMRELFGKRRSTRHPRSSRLSLHTTWTGPPATAELIDLSLTGLALAAHVAVAENVTVRVIETGFDAVAEVVACRRRGAGYVIHARILTLQTRGQGGVMVSVRA